MTVEFRIIVFRPFKGEIILGKISSSSEQGIKSQHCPVAFPFLLLAKHVHPFVLFPPWLSSRATIVRLDFFNDIFIPGDLLFPESRL